MTKAQNVTSRSEKNYAFELFVGKIHPTLTLNNSKPRYLEQFFIPLGCSRYRGLRKWFMLRKSSNN